MVLNCAGNVYNIGNLLANMAVVLQILSIVNVVTDLYGLMGQLVEKAEYEGVQCASLREMTR